jgi:DNA modification methylase
MTMKTQEVVQTPIDTLRPAKANARVHSKKQLKQIARSIQRYGFNAPVLIGDDHEIIAGHGRVEAAKLLGLTHVPSICLAHLNEIERRAYLIADNKIALNAGWDQDLLAGEMQVLIDHGFDIADTGFSIAEADILLEEANDAAPVSKRKAEAEDRIPDVDPLAVTRMGDVWQLGRHRLICGDARDVNAYAALLNGEEVDLIFTDPPYNVKIDRNVSGKGAAIHREFAFASGEMNDGEFAHFLAQSLGAAASRCRDGAIAFVCMDWRHMGELLEAGRHVFAEMKNLCVWNKPAGGLGSCYRSKHELVFMFKVGTAEHVNTFGLGGDGRYRTNVWDYAGNSSINATRMEELAMHPTVKPVAMIKDAILDCTHRGHIVLDCFAGSGSTLVAAHKVGRVARLIEYDPLYCDVIIRRFEKLTGKQAILEATGHSFEDTQDLREAEAQIGEAA